MPAFGGQRAGARGRQWSTAVVLAILLAAMVPAGGTTAAAAPPQSLMELAQSAEQAYAQGDYDTAIEAYERMLASGWISASLFYNLGCAYHRSGMLGRAVANLEEARRLSPRDPDIRHNFAIVTAQVSDRLPEEEASWLLDLLAAVLDSYRPIDIVRVLIMLSWALAIVLAASWLLPRGARRWARRLLGLLGALLVLACGGLALKAYQVQSAASGVVVAQEVAVLSGPLEGETVQFALHAGTRIHVGRSTGTWREVWLSQEMRGWVSQASVIELREPSWLP